MILVRIAFTTLSLNVWYQSEYLQQSCACSYRCSDLSGKPRKSNGRNKMKKIWITGAEGHIGTALLDLLEGVEYQLLKQSLRWKS